MDYEKEAKKNDDAGKYADEALPTLRKHLDAAQNLSHLSAKAKR